jgi:hypothetical protein
MLSLVEALCYPGSCLPRLQIDPLLHFKTALWVGAQCQKAVLG